MGWENIGNETSNCCGRNLGSVRGQDPELMLPSEGRVYSNTQTTEKLSSCSNHDCHFLSILKLPWQTSP